MFNQRRTIPYGYQNESPCPTGTPSDRRTKPGETVAVSAAAGAVGAVVGQLAKIKECRVVGIAGAPDKCAYVVNELGFDAAVSHYEPDLSARLEKECPKGIDVYFENVGGKVFEAAFPLLNDFARIPVSGLIAHYNDTELPAGPNQVPLLTDQNLPICIQPTRTLLLGRTVPVRTPWIRLRSESHFAGLRV